MCISKSRVTFLLLGPIALAASPVRGQKIYWNGGGVNAIERINEDGSHRQPVASGKWSAPCGIAIDSVHGTVYWADEDNDAPLIQRANLDGSDIQDAVALPPDNRPRDVVVDSAGGKVYWTDINLNKIIRADLDGANVEEFLGEALGVRQPFGLALDPVHRYLYWGEPVSHPPGVRRIALSGGYVEDVALDVRPISLAIDPVRSKVYWLTENSPDSMIQRANLDGTSVEYVVVSGLEFSPQAIALDPQAGKLYITSDNAGSIQQANLDGTELGVLFQSITSQPVGIDVDTSTGKIYWADRRMHSIRRANGDGTGVEQLVQLPANPSAISVTFDPRAGKMYWAAWNGLPLAGDVRRSNLDGSNTEVLVRGPLAYDVDDPRFQPISIALDTTAGRMYWVDSESEKIQSANLDGSDVADVIETGLMNDIRHPYGIAIDPAAGRLFWSEYGNSGYGVRTGRIQRAKLDGTEITTIVSDLLAPSAVALDVSNGKIYWADHDLYRIQRADTDGGGVETIVHVSGYMGTFDFALDLTAGKMYWGEMSLYVGQKIIRANLDGLDTETVAAPGPPVVIYGLAVARVPGFAAESDSGRYLPLVLPDVAEPFALRTTSPDLTCVQRYVQGDGRLGGSALFRTSPEWGVVAVRGREVVPSAYYEVELEFEDGVRSVPAVTKTAQWGDTAGLFLAGAWVDPDGQVLLSDAVACLDAYRNAPNAPRRVRCDLEPEIPDERIRILDIVRILDAFRGLSYPFAAPCP